MEYAFYRVFSSAATLKLGSVRKSLFLSKLRKFILSFLFIDEIIKSPFHLYNFPDILTVRLACYCCATYGCNRPLQTKLCTRSYYKYKSCIFAKDYVDKKDNNGHK